MGVRGLEQYVRNKVPNGCPVIDIRNEIRTCRSSDSPPTIVIDFRSLFDPLCHRDIVGILCGGRYEVVYQVVERFFNQLQQLGARLVFFSNGNIKNARKVSHWIEQQNEKYTKELAIIDTVDSGADVPTLVRRFRKIIPDNTLFPVKTLAKRFGEFRVSLTSEPKREMVAYANSVNALAIVSNNSDLMIFGGNWQFWSSKDINFKNLTTREFSRDALRRHLGLDEGQLALFATLASNNEFLRSDELELFVLRNLPNQYDFQALAEFVRRPRDNLLKDAFGQQASEGDLNDRFQESLDYYGTEYLEQDEPASDDPTEEFLKVHGKSFLLKIWTAFPLHFGASFVDLRDDGFGSEYTNLSKQIILREAAIIVYHRRNHPDHKNRQLIHKLSHEEGYTEQTYEMEFPTHVEPPTLQELLSTDPETHSALADTKLQLYAWIISDSLTVDQLKSIPPKLMPTVATIYLLVERQVIELFEADLLLQVTHEVTSKSLDMFSVEYPQHLDPRAFRLAFLYLAISKHTLKTLNVVGFKEQDYPKYPQFDGIRFHNLYRDWTRGGERNLEQIRRWRIYENIF